MLGGVGGATVLAAGWGGTRSAAAQGAAQIESGAGRWKPWLLRSGSELRLPPPPDRAASEAEIRELRALAAQRDPTALEQITHWDAGAPGYHWNGIAIGQGLKAIAGGLRNYRALALLNVAIYDATIAAWDTKYTYNRPRPSELDPSLATVLPNPRSPSYPAEHAVVAGAASAVLGYLMPNDAQLFADHAEQAARSRLLAGVQYPSDIRAGLELGRAVAERVIEYAKTDGSDAQWTGTVPTGPGIWRGTNPAEPLGGTWKTWVLASGSQLRPDPPPAHDSPELAAELAAVRGFERTVDPVGPFWAHDPAGRPASAQLATAQAAYHWAPLNHLIWCSELEQKLFEYRLDANPPRAARAYALVSVAGYDAAVACWDAKYAYWLARPIHLDPTITTLFATPAHPSYPSGHAAIVGGTSATLAYLFPRAAECFRLNAEEMAASRLWAGIHYRLDDDDGLEMGRAVAQAVIARAQADGSS
jgi:membrane-associated phospholipid phosphatase